MPVYAKERVLATRRLEDFKRRKAEAEGRIIKKDIRRIRKCQFMPKREC